jgi:hypothetical protein
VLAADFTALLVKHWKSLSLVQVQRSLVPEVESSLAVPANHCLAPYFHILPILGQFPSRCASLVVGTSKCPTKCPAEEMRASQFRIDPHLFHCPPGEALEKLISFSGERLQANPDK